MKTHSINFKSQITQLGRQLRAVITYNTTTLEEEIYSITPHYEADILKSVMKQLDLELSVPIALNTVINCQIGILVNNSYEMLNFGNYVVYNVEKQEDTNTYKIICYDKLLYSMKQNEDLNITYPITIKNYLIALGNKIGLSVADTTFYNQDMQIPSELYLGLEYTYRDILDEIAQATGSIICLNENDEIQVKYPTQTNDTIDEEYLKDVNVKFGERYGAINTIVLSRAGESDNVYYPDPLPANPIEIKIVDNQIMNFNNRSDYLEGIYNALNGLYYYINDFTSTGILYYDVGDLYNIQVGENTYQCLMLNDEINVTTGIEEIIHTDMPEQSETDYTKADKTDMRINKTYLIVDKQNQKIESVISNVNSQNNKISQLTQTVDELNSRISDISDITTSGESMQASVQLSNINQSEPIELIVHPITQSISYLYPRSNLYPSSSLYLTTRTIRFIRTYDDNGTTRTQNIDYILPDDLLYYDSENYDEFILNYDSHTCQVRKKCKYNADGTVGLLSSEVVTDYTYPTIQLEDGDYQIKILNYNIGYLSVRLMAQNIYTTQFATKAEVTSEINQKADSITASVNQTFSNYSTTNQMNSTIQLKANEITSSVSETYATKTALNNNVTTLNSTITQTANNLQSQITSNDNDISSINQTINGVTIEVGKKYNTSDFTNAKITAKINDGTSNVQISASKVSLAGKIIQLTSDNIAINSTNFSVDKNGNMTCNNATLQGILNFYENGTLLTSIKKGTYKNGNTGASGTASIIEVADTATPSFAIRRAGKNDIADFYKISTSQLRGISSSDGYTGFIDVNGAVKASNIITNYIRTYSPSDSSVVTIYDGLSVEKNIFCSKNVYANSFVNTSKEENKKNFEKIENALNIIKNIDIYKYNYKNEKDNIKKHIGFVIGDNFKYSQDVTSQENDGVDVYSFVSLCCKAIQEQQEQIEQLKNEIKELKGEK